MTREKEELAYLMPHRDKMLLLSRLKEYNLEKGTLCAECDIAEDCLFYDPLINGVPAWAGFEFMAQAISALCGLWMRNMGQKPRVGFIMSVSSMRIGIPVFNIGSRLEIKVREYNSVETVHNFSGEIFLDGRNVIEGKLTVLDVTEEQIEIMKKEAWFN